jgi:hypothetical protein
MSISAANKRSLAASEVATRRLALAFILGGLTLAVLLSRLPFQVGILTNFDAVNYTLALEHFDMRLSQPQAPGYPLYVLLGRAFWWAGSLLGPLSPAAALVWLSMVSSSLGVAAIFLAGQTIFNTRVGWGAALMLAASSVYWYTSQIASPYTLDLLFSVVVGWLTWRLLHTRPDSGWKEPALWLAAVGVGLAGAFRLQTLVFLLPLFVYAARCRPWQQIAAGLAAALGIFALFFVPAVYLSGGPRTFVRLMVGVVPLVRDIDTLARTTRWERFYANALTIGRYTFRSLGEPVIPLLLLGAASTAGALRFWRSPRLVFLLVWLGPAWLVYFLIWPGNIGTILVTLPPLFLLAAAGLDQIVHWTKRGPLLAALALGSVLLWNVLVFTVFPPAPWQGQYRTFENFASLQRTAASYQERLALVESLPAAGTVVIADDFRHLQYYLPAYRSFNTPQFAKDDPQTLRRVVSLEDGKMFALRDMPAGSWLPPGIRRIAFFAYPSGLQLGEGLKLQEKWGANYSIFVVEAPPGEAFHWNGKGLSYAGK